jgi:glutathione S-transferase
MIKLFWCPKTRASRILWMLEEMGEPFEVETVDLYRPETKSVEFLAASPMGKVPAIADGPVKIADSAAIALYLADRYPASALAPAIDDPLRGSYLYWMTFTPGVIEPAMAEKFNNWEVNRGPSGWGDYDLMMEVLEKGLAQGPWVLGDRFSAADVMVGSAVRFMKLFGNLPEKPVLARYLDRCLARPGYASALARDAEVET